jgi:plasmid maintenance system antidote protein VapI
MSKSKRKQATRQTVADLLRRRILESETVAELARGAGIAQPVLHRFVHGERDLTLRTAEKLLRYFDLEITDKVEWRTTGRAGPTVKGR